MKNFRSVAFALLLLVTAGTFLGCSRDPNVRKQKYLESGNRYFEKHQYREAAIQYSNAAVIDPRFTEAHYRLAQAYLKLKAFGNAYSELRRTVELDPGKLQARLDLGNLALAARNLSEAEEQSQSVLDKSPTNVDARLLLANVRASQGKTDEAISEIGKAIAQSPNRGDLYGALAAYQEQSGNKAEVEKSLRKAIDVDPKETNARIRLAGLLLQRDHDVAQAEQLIRQAISIAPDDPQTHLSLILMYLGNGMQPQAEEAAKDAKAKLAENPDGYTMLAEYYVLTHQYPKAVDEYGNLAKQYPQDQRVENNYIQGLIDLNQLDTAEQLNQKRLKRSNNKSTDALTAQAQILIARGKTAEAEQPLQAALKGDPANAIAHFAMGSVRQSAGDTAQAEKEWREAARLSPSLLRAQLMLAQLALANHELDLLRDAAEQIIKFDPTSPDGYRLLGIEQINQKQYAQADASLKKALDLSPNDTTTLLAIAELRKQQHRTAEAETILNGLLAKDDNSAATLQSLSSLYVDQKQPGKAIALLQKRTEQFPNDGTAYALLGKLQFSTNDLKGAEASLQKATQLKPHDIDAFFMLGRVQATLGEKDQALKTSENWVKNNPNDVRAYVMLAAELDQRGDWQTAQDLYKKALQLKPDYPFAANNLADLMLRHGGNVDVALSLAQTARRGMLNSPDSADTLGWAYYNKGVYGSAKDLLEEAAKADPNNATFQLHLGLLYQKMNDKDKAKQHLNRALQLSAKSADTTEIRKALNEI